MATLLLFPCAAAFLSAGPVFNRNLLMQSRLPGLNQAPRIARRQLWAPLMNAFVTHYEELSVPTGRTVSMVDITKEIREVVSKSGCQEGVVTVLSKHSTVSVTINEMEGRLVDDTRQFLLKLAPPNFPYLHNDLDERVCAPVALPVLETGL